jgi:hypothetical protein
MHLVALAGLAIGSAVFSVCAIGDFTSYSGQQQNTLVKPHGREQGGYPQSPTFVDWTKDARSQLDDTYPEYNGIGIP